VTLTGVPVPPPVGRAPDVAIENAGRHFFSSRDETGARRGR